MLAKGERCSSQTIVTRCTLYKQYTTEDALETAADSYARPDRPLYAMSQNSPTLLPSRETGASPSCLCTVS